jgi:hypothetical protein
MTAGTKTAIENPQTAIAAVKLLLDGCSVPRLAMQGTSMLPLFHEPMVLELEPIAGPLRLGDVVVFEEAGRLVAHRVTAIGEGRLQTCGDARPWSPEYPPAASLVGKVKAVRARDGADAPRVDSPSFRTLGSLYARTRGLRALPFRAGFVFRRMGRALPWARRRPYLSLLDATSAIVRNETQAFDRSIARADAPALAGTARRHGCAAMLLEALGSFETAGPQADYLRRALQLDSRSAVLLSLVAKRDVNTVAGALAGSRIPFALLKGAARLYADEPGATLHASGDFDVLVPADRLDAAIQVLRAQGYDERRYAAKRERYLARHHHAAPLFPPATGFAVELHTALAPPGQLSTPLDWEALRELMTPVAGSAGEVLCLNRIGAALHLGVHAIGLRRLRDTVLLARLLAAMSGDERAKLAAIVAHERIDPVRLRASFVLAARLAGIAWPSDAVVERYLEWAARREDVPRYFAERSQLAEGWYAADRKLTTLCWRLLDPRSGLDEEPQARSFWRIAGRVGASASALAYARCMKGLP